MTTVAVQVPYNSWYILFLSLQNTRNEQTLHCSENLSMCLRFSFMIALRVINKVNDFRVLQDSEAKYKIIFN